MRVRTALRLGRISNLPTVWTNVLAAAALAGVTTPDLALLGIAVACSCFYVGGMFLNDAFDAESDARLRPDRPIPAGVVEAGLVFRVGFALLGLGTALAVAIAPIAGTGTAGPSLGSALALAGAIVLYDARHKGNPLAPLLMGLCRVFVYTTTTAILVGTVPPAVLAGALVVLGYLIGLTSIARHPVFGSRRWLVAGLIAGIALLDGVLIVLAGAPALALWCVAAFGLTLALQRWVPGT